MSIIISISQFHEDALCFIAIDLCNRETATQRILDLGQALMILGTPFIIPPVTRSNTIFRVWKRVKYS